MRHVIRMTGQEMTWKKAGMFLRKLTLTGLELSPWNIQAKKLLGLFNLSISIPLALDARSSHFPHYSERPFAPRRTGIILWYNSV